MNGDDAEIAVKSALSKMHFDNLYNYCNCNPVMCVDDSGYAAKYIDYQGENKTVMFGNKSKKMKNIKWGPLGNIWKNGCGIIAAYNVQRYYSSKVTFKNVYLALAALAGPLALGLGGTRISSITLYLRKKFLVVLTAGCFTTFWGLKAELSTCVVVLYKTKGFGAHYIAGIRTRKGGVGGRFKFYNAPSYMDGNDRSIWDIIDLIKENGGTPIALWGISGKRGWW